MMKKFDLHTHQSKENAIINGYLESYVLTKQWKSLGIHPWFITANWRKKISEFQKEIASGETVVAIGECGLDKVCKTDFSLQIEVFEQHIELAKRFNKPLLIHCVKAFNECEKLLREVKKPVVFHGFIKNKHVLQQLLKHTHFYFSFGEAVFKKSMLETLKSCPLDRLFLETDDCPIEIDQVYKQVASIKGVTLNELERQVLLNRRVVFGI